MRACVVDASVAAKWLLPAAGEDLVDQANHLLRSHIQRELHLVAPDLIRAEIGNVLWKAVRTRRTTRAAARQSLQYFQELALEIIPADVLLAPAFEIAATYDRSFYDSLYVALALDIGADLITADEPMVNAVGSRFPVRWLGTFQP